MFSQQDEERYSWLEQRAKKYQDEGMAASLALMHARVDWYREMFGGDDENPA